MKAIAFVTQKGGSGKSTLCINLAVAAQAAGASVCILEMDRQATVSDWAESRGEKGPEVAQIEAAQIDEVMKKLKSASYEYVFIDTPGVDSAGALALALIPCRPTPADLRAFKPTLAALGMLADVSIVTRNDYQDAIGLGQGVTEFNPTGQAADEVRRLWTWVEKRLKGSSGKGAEFIANRALQGKRHVKAA